MQPKFHDLPICRGDITLRMARGHFATPNSHVNTLIDMTRQKTSFQEATAVAQRIAAECQAEWMVDTIFCLDNTRLIGGCLARELTQTGFYSVNAGQDMHVVHGEVDNMGRLIFRDNSQPLIKGKHVLILMASVTTGKTAARSLESIEYYGGHVAGIAALYSSVKEQNGVLVKSLFSLSDLADYESYSADNCPLCKAGIPLDALLNSFGYTVL